MIKAVLFDHGGVLLEGGRADSISNIIFNLYGVRVNWGDIAELHQQMVTGMIDSATFFEELARLCHSVRTVTEAEWREAGSDVYTRSTAVYKLAAKLRQHDVRTGIVSNVYAMTAAEHRRLGNYSDFSPLVLSCDAHLAKPDRAIYEFALEQLGVASENVIFVDDQDKYLHPAQGLGMQTVLAVDAQQIVSDVTRLVEEQNGVHL